MSAYALFSPSMGLSSTYSITSPSNNNNNKTLHHQLSGTSSIETSTIGSCRKDSSLSTSRSIQDTSNVGREVGIAVNSARFDASRFVHYIATTGRNNGNKEKRTQQLRTKNGNECESPSSDYCNNTGTNHEISTIGQDLSCLSLASINTNCNHYDDEEEDEYYDPLCDDDSSCESTNQSIDDRQFLNYCSLKNDSLSPSSANMSSSSLPTNPQKNGIPSNIVTTTTTPTAATTVHEDAIQFDLSITFNGRSYSATRTLQSMIKLRNELIRELNIRREQLRRKIRWRRNSSSKLSSASLLKTNALCLAAAALSNKEKLYGNGDDDVTIETVDDGSTVQSDADASSFDAEADHHLTFIDIPELPQCIGADNFAVGGDGLACRGFTMLHALLRSYCPDVERWLRNVADIVPPNTSPTLANFLWEPLSQQGNSNDATASKVVTEETNSSGSNPHKTKLSSSNQLSSFSTLASIEEGDDGYGSDEDMKKNR